MAWIFVGLFCQDVWRVGGWMNSGDVKLVDKSELEGGKLLAFLPFPYIIFVALYRRRRMNII